MGDGSDPAVVAALCRDLAVEAGALAGARFGDPGLAVDEKADGSPVTEADLAAEALLRRRLASLRPDDAVVGEEDDDVAGTSGLTWFLDPIDGTRAFARGVPIWATLVAVHDGRGALAGAVALPALDEVVWAGRGAGAFVGERPARVSGRRSLDGAYLTTSAFESWTEPALVAVRRSGAALRTWGDAYGYALVATGRVDVMVDPVVSAWDVAPMPVILAEAGGRFSDLDGADRIDGGSGLGSNGRVHDAAIDLLAPLR